jgi:TolB-like protein
LEAPAQPKSAFRSCSIAVLPFEDFSPNRDQRHFCKGMAEELINTLARVQGLRVVARTSAFSFGGHKTDILTIGRILNADAVVEGSVRKEGNTLRIAAQLVSADNGFQLWSRQYDRELGDVFEIQESIARSIAAAVSPLLNGIERTPDLRGQNTDPGAYELFVKGRSHLYRQSPEGLAQAIHYLEKAVEADPSFAPAHAGLAEAHLSEAKLGLSPAGRNPDEAKKASERAVGLDHALPQAHVAVANSLVDRD